MAKNNDKSVLDEARKTAEKVAGDVVKPLAGTLDAAGKAVEGAGKEVAKALGSVDAVGKAVAEALGLVQAAATGMSGIGSEVDKTLKGVKKAGEDIIAGPFKVVKELLAKVEEALRKLLQDIGRMLAAPGRIAKIVEDVTKTNLLRKASRLMNRVEAIMDDFDFLAAELGVLIRTIEKLSVDWNRLTARIQKEWNALSASLKKVGDTINKAFSDFIKSIKSTILGLLGRSLVNAVIKQIVATFKSKKSKK